MKYEQTSLIIHYSESANDITTFKILRIYPEYCNEEKLYLILTSLH